MQAVDSKMEASGKMFKIWKNLQAGKDIYAMKSNGKNFRK